MKFCANDPKFGKLFVTDRNAGFVLPWVERCAHGQSGLGRCTCDEIDDDLVRGKRATAPVLGDETEQPVLDLVPLAGAGRKVTDVQGNVQFVGQSLQGFLPQPITAAVAATSVRRDQQFAGPREPGRAHFVPPAVDARACELSSVVIDPDAHPSFIGGQVVDSVRNRLAQLWVGKVVDVHGFGLALGLPFFARILEFSHQLLLLRIHRDDGLVPPLKGPHLAVDVLELIVPVRVRRAFAGFAVGLQAVAVLLQQQCDGAIRNRVVPFRQFLGQFGRALAGPAQRRHGIATRGGFDQSFQGLQQPRIRFSQRPAPASRAPNTRSSHRTGLRWLLQVLDSCHDRGTREAGGSRHQRNAAPANLLGLNRRPLPAPALVQFDGDKTILAADPCLDFRILHATVIADSAEVAKVNL